LEDLLQARPNHQEGKKQLAEMYERMGRLKEAAEIYERLLQRNPNLYQSVAWQLKNLYENMGKTEELDEMRDQVLARASTPRALEQVARQFSNEREYAKAVDAYERLMRMNPQPHHQQSLAYAYRQLGEHQKAIETYKRWLSKQQHHSFDSLRSIGEYFLMLDRWEEFEDLRGQIGSGPNKETSEKHFDAAKALVELRFGDAFALIKELDNPQHPQMVHRVVSLFRQVGPNEAMVALLRELDLDELQRRHDPQMVPMLLQAGMQDKAFQIIDQWMADAGHSKDYEVQRAMEAVVRNQEWDELLERMDKDPRWKFGILSQFSPAHMRALADRLQRDPEELFKEWLSELEPEQQTTVVQSSLRRHAHMEGNDDFVLSALEVMPDSEELRKLAVDTSDRQQNPEEILELSRRLSPDKPTILEAEQLMQLGRENEAVAVITEIMEAGQVEPSEALRMSQILKDAWRFRTIHELRDAALEQAGELKRSSLALSFAMLEGETGSVEVALEAAQKAFAETPSRETFKRLYSFLRDRGAEERALALLVEHADSGMVQHHHVHQALRALLEHLGLEETVDLVWKNVVSGPPHNRKHQVQNTLRNLAGHAPVHAVAEEVFAQWKEKAPEDAALLQTIENSLVGMGGEPLTKDADAAGADTETVQAGEQPDAAAGTVVHSQGRSASEPKNPLAPLRESVAGLMEEGAYEEAEKKARELLRRSPMRGKYNAVNTLAEVLLKAERPQEAHAVWEELLSWNRSAQVLAAAGRFYLEQEQPDRAVELLKQAVISEFNYERDLVAALAAAGRYEELEQRALLTSRHIHPLQSKIQELLQQGQVEHAAHLFRVMRPLPTVDTANSWHILTLFLQHGRTDLFEETCRYWFDTGDREEQLAVARRYVERMRRAEGAEISEFGALDEDDDFRRMVRLVQLLEQGGQLTEDDIAWFETLPSLDPDRLKNIADRLKAQNDERWVDWMFKAALHPRASKSVANQAALAFAREGMTAKAYEVFQHVKERQLSVVVRHAEYLEVLAELGSEEDLEEAREVFARLCAYDSDVRFYEALLQYYQGDQDAALDVFEDLAGARERNWTQLNIMAPLLKRAGRTDAAYSVWGRVAAGPYGRSLQDAALQQLIEIDLERGNWESALVHASDLSGIHHNDNVLGLFKVSLTQEGLPAFRDGLRRVARQKRKSMYVGDLVVRMGRLAQQAGEPIDVAAICAEAGVDGYALERARVLANPVKSFALAAPGAPSSSESAEEAADALFAALPDLPEGWGWAAPHQQNEAPLSPQRFDLQSEHGFAVALLKADRPVEAELSVDMKRGDGIWLDGERVATAPAAEQTPDFMRVKLQLEPGQHCLAIEMTRGWPTMRVSLVDDVEGLRFSRPDDNEEEKPEAAVEGSADAAGKNVSAAPEEEAAGEATPDPEAPADMADAA
jgi:tetratricopeptide (TPR) repeat protein